MEGAIAALAQPDSWYEALNAEYAARQAIAGRIMDALGCTWRHGQQGLFLWGRIPDTEKSAEAFADRILAEKRVFITPGFIFGKAGERYVRISLCAPQATLLQALDRI